MLKNGGARAYLRSATAHLHAELDARLAPLLKQGEAGYAQFLAGSASVILPVEQVLTEANVAALLPDWRLRSRSLALRQDLAELALAEPLGLTPPEATGEAFQFGMLYVLEGSRLGARLLLHDVLATLGPATRTATRYLRHGQGMPLWSRYLKHLEASQPVRDEPEKAAAGARAMFKRFLTAASLDRREVTLARG
jgi:heme oxygenase